MVTDEVAERDARGMNTHMRAVAHWLASLAAALPGRNRRIRRKTSTATGWTPTARSSSSSALRPGALRTRRLAEEAARSRPRPAARFPQLRHQAAEPLRLRPRRRHRLQEAAGRHVGRRHRLCARPRHELLAAMPRCSTATRSRSPATCCCRSSDRPRCGRACRASRPSARSRRR